MWMETRYFSQSAQKTTVAKKMGDEKEKLSE
jgi:hypothetical protein